MTIRNAIITVCGHVDHGKTSLLDAFRGSSLQAGEAGGITQKISFTKFPLEQVHAMCPLLNEKKIPLKIPGFLFIDTPGHAAFTNLRKRGGSLADLAVVVIDIKEGIKPQTAEVLSILKANRTPFVIALNKIDTLSGWRNESSVKETIERLPVNTRQHFDELLLTFQGSLQSHGFESDLFYEISDYTKRVALVPCSAKTKQGISELLFMLCGLCQKFLSEQLTVGKDAKGVILEIKKERGFESAEAILYDGSLEAGGEIAIASFGKPIVTKVRALEEIQPLSTKFNSTNKAEAATGVRIQLTDKEGIMSGMPFQEIHDNLDELAKQFEKEISNVKTDKQGIIIKADSLGSLEALITLLHQANISVVKAGIGPITKTDIVAAKANLDQNPLDAIILGFNVEKEEDVIAGKIPIFTDEVVYKLIEKIEMWRKDKQAEVEKEKLMGLATICKLEILPQYVFRNSNPAIFGIKVVTGKIRTGLPLINDQGDEISHVKALQVDKASVQEATQGMELAISLPGVTFDRQLKATRFLYVNLSLKQMAAIEKQRDLFAGDELKVLSEIRMIKEREQ